MFFICFVLAVPESSNLVIQFCTNISKWVVSLLIVVTSSCSFLTAAKDQTQEQIGSSTVVSDLLGCFATISSTKSSIAVIFGYSVLGFNEDISETEERRFATGADRNSIATGVPTYTGSKHKYAHQVATNPDLVTVASTVEFADTGIHNNLIRTSGLSRYFRFARTPQSPGSLEIVSSKS